MVMENGKKIDTQYKPPTHIVVNTTMPSTKPFLQDHNFVVECVTTMQPSIVTENV